MTGDGGGKLVTLLPEFPGGTVVLVPLELLAVPLPPETLLEAPLPLSPAFASSKGLPPPLPPPPPQPASPNTILSTVETIRSRRRLYVK